MTDVNQTDIDRIIYENSVQDLRRFINKRSCLISYNICLTYLFHFVNTAGMVVTTIAASNDYKPLVWVGITLNGLSSLILIYERTNESILDKLLENILNIKKGQYVDDIAISPKIV